VGPGGGRRDGTAPQGEAEKAEPTTPEREATRGNVPDVSPENIRQPDLVLNQIKDMLRDPRRAEELAEASGMSTDELSQFVRKFEKAPDFEPGEARTLEVEPGAPQQVDPDRLPAGPLPKATVSSRSQRGPNSVVQDEAGGNVQGVRTAVPPEYSSRFEAYRKGLSGGVPAAAPAPGGGR